MAILIGMSESIKGRKFDVDHETVTIGRRPSNVIILDESSVSGAHCSITKDGAKFTLRDLGSTNGTGVNGRAIKECRLNPKDILQIGNLELMFDGTDIEPDTTPGASATTRIEVFSEPARVPTTFQTASPFGARHGRHGHLWSIIVAVVGALAVIFLIFILVRIFSPS
jgi:predicted component of type VI protein secretion system